MRSYGSSTELTLLDVKTGKSNNRKRIDKVPLYATVTMHDHVACYHDSKGS